MLQKLILTLILMLSTQAFAQDITQLKKTVEEVVSGKNAIVGLAINDSSANNVLSINGEQHFPMQSVFKFPIALAVLSEVDKGNLTLDQEITIKKEELLPGLWSPIRKKYPEGTTLPLAEIIEYTVALSDNVGCDVLVRLLGGPEYVEQYFSNLGFKDFAVKINEETMQSNWDLQFLNWTTPEEANRILTIFYENNNGLLSDKSHEFIWNIMKETKTGKNRLRGQLPEETVVAHKTGWSGQHPETGITAATNNIGIVFLPSGGYFSISVFVMNSTEDTDTNERIIADISKAAWDYFLSK